MSVLVLVFSLRSWGDAVLQDVVPQETEKALSSGQLSDPQVLFVVAQ